MIYIIIGCVLLIFLSTAFVLYFKQHKCLGFLYENEQNIIAKIEEFNKYWDDMKSQYISHSVAEAFIADYSEFADSLSNLRIPKRHKLYQQINAFLDSYRNYDFRRKISNAVFMKNEKDNNKELLSNIDGKALDDQQQSVVVADEDNTLVLAGAGSGKTLTISGKVKYLCDVKKVDPKDILLISFTKNAAEEMTDRIKNKLNVDIEATTFHKLGLGIISKEKGYRPNVYDDLDGFVKNYFENIVIHDEKVVRALIELFAYYIEIPADLEQCSSLGEAYMMEKSSDFETIKSKYDKNKFIDDTAKQNKATKTTFNGEKVKSLEEVSIANFLFLHGIEYEYERLYPYDTGDPMKKGYRPDFYLPEYDIYIEHFGITSDYKVPWLSPIEEEKYLEGIKWKRDLHKNNSTKLLETYSYYSSQGCLLDKLKEILQKNGVKFKTPDFADIFNTLYIKESDKYFSEIIKLFCTFIHLFKSNGYKTEDLASLTFKSDCYNNPFFVKRTFLFKQIIRSVIEAYNKHLEDNNAVDFSDMINFATSAVLAGCEIHPYKYIIIDEYQDISVSRFKLIKAIMDVTKAKLLCVGDDWQSIYRFAGSDISLFTDFSKYVGYSEIMKIEKTYRNSQQLIDEAGHFIMQNPMQMHKQLCSDKALAAPIMFWGYSKEPKTQIKNVIDKIIEQSGVDESIMILGRTSYDLNILEETGLFFIRKNTGKVIYKGSAKTPIVFKTAHKSKGLEADNVIILNFNNTKLGFPNKISDDCILELVLSDADRYIHAEERRLLYVALTRTKNKVHILYDEDSPSEFIFEFKESTRVHYATKSVVIDEEALNCPKCKSGKLVLRNGVGNEDFLGCTNYPYCDYKLRDVSVLKSKKRCWDCGGYMVQRHGKYSTFWGCTNYPRCSHTEPISNTKRVR